jgi:hypothetical protein
MTEDAAEKVTVMAIDKTKSIILLLLLLLLMMMMMIHCKAIHHHPSSYPPIITWHCSASSLKCSTRHLSTDAFPLSLVLASAHKLLTSFSQLVNTPTSYLWKRTREEMVNGRELKRSRWVGGERRESGYVRGDCMCLTMCVCVCLLTCNHSSSHPPSSAVPLYTLHQNLVGPCSPPDS